MRILPFLALILACNGDKPPGGDTPAEGEGEGEGEGEPECTADPDCGDGRICEDESCEDGDRNNEFDEAETILWDAEASGTINPVTDVDYFSFEAEGGEFIRINSALSEEDRETADELGYDTALTLRDGSGKVVASVNDYPTGGRVNTYDAVLYAYLADAGTYTIQVEDLGTFDGSKAPEGDPEYGYTISLAETGSHTRETDAIDDPSLDVDISGANTLYAVGVVLDEAGDSDWVEVNFPYGEAGINVLGAFDLGGSDAYPEVRLWSDDDEMLTDKVGVGPEGVAFYPSMEDARYVLELTDAYGGGSAESWYFVFLLAQEEGEAYDAEEEPNDSQEEADQLTQYTAEADAGDYTYARARGDLAAEGDLDWYLLEGMEEGYLIVCLSSSLYGSTVAPTVSVYDSAGALLDSQTGDPDSDDGTTIIDNLSIAEEDYLLSVSAPAGESGLSAWYAMIVYTTSFETDSYSCP